MSRWPHRSRLLRSGPRDATSGGTGVVPWGDCSVSRGPDKAAASAIRPARYDIGGRPPGDYSQARAAAVSAVMPVRIVGSMTGANSGEWLDGRPSTMSLASSTVVTPANRAGSEPPKNQ